MITRCPSVLASLAVDSQHTLATVPATSTVSIPRSWSRACRSHRPGKKALAAPLSSTRSVGATSSSRASRARGGPSPPEPA